MFDMAEEFMVERRIDLESNDYPGTGANNRHDPKTSDLKEKIPSIAYSGDMESLHNITWDIILD